MMSSIFETVKQSVTMEAVAERYGLSINKGKALCPFHNDTHPSLFIRKDFFYCFVCDAGGDQIAFVSRLCGLTPLKAAEQIAAEFGLDRALLKLTAYQTIHKKRELREKELFLKWETEVFKYLARAYRDISANFESHRGLYRTDDLDSALSRHSRTEYFLNILTFGTKEEKTELYLNHKEEVDFLAYPGNYTADRRFDRRRTGTAESAV